MRIGYVRAKYSSGRKKKEEDKRYARRVSYG